MLLLPNLGILRLQVLLCWGKKDQFLRSQSTQKSIAKCTSGKLVMVKDVNHWIHHQQPYLINTLIDDFVTMRQRT